jgi:hypothetical protein
LWLHIRAPEGMDAAKAIIRRSLRKMSHARFI